VLIDGEHYPPVVRAALTRLTEQFEPVAALFVGGREKLRSADDAASGLAAAAAEAADLSAVYGLPVHTARSFADGSAGSAFGPGGVASELAALLRASAAATVVDLSDEPVLGYEQRFLLVSAALAAGARYLGADFSFSPPRFARLATKPALAIIGTGKRVGKTAVSGYAARLLDERYRSEGGVAVLAMGRGGPPQPEVADGPGLSAGDLLALSRQGRHAASDCYEDALLAGVTTIGCRRCGGGMAGSSYDDTVAEALPLLERQPAALVLLEGSGSVIPPVAAQATICVASAAQPHEYISGFLGTYRLLLADLLVVTMCEAPLAREEQVARLVGAVRSVKPNLMIVPVVLRPRPTASLRGRRVALFTTAGREGLTMISAHLEREYGAEVAVVSADLADRGALAAAVQRAAREADVFVSEIKAAAIDVVAEAAAASGRELVFLNNEPVPVAYAGLPAGDLAAAIGDLGDACRRRFAEPE
jgi:cyclic 2,3-diphosphoglycerate synthetase